MCNGAGCKNVQWSRRAEQEDARMYSGAGGQRRRMLECTVEQEGRARGC
jgi:hypothetical protein